MAAHPVLNPPPEVELQIVPLIESFNVGRLNAIARTFGVAVSDNVAAARMLAFDAVVNASLDGRWTEIRAAQEIIQGITDVQGRCVYNVLVDEGHEIAVGIIARSNDLLPILSDGHYVPTLHGAAARGAVQMMKQFADTADINGRLPSSEGEDGVQVFVQLPAALPVAERIERKALRNALDANLLPPNGWNREVATPTIALIGEDGVGKSEAAKRFCEDNVDAKDQVFRTPEDFLLEVQKEIEDKNPDEQVELSLLQSQISALLAHDNLNSIDWKFLPW